MQTTFNKTKTKSNNTKKKAVNFTQSLPQYKPEDVKKILVRLSQSYENSHTRQILTLLETRSKKVSELRKKNIKPIDQPPMYPAHSSERFSESTPISAGEKYLLEKFRTNIIAPQRIYDRKPNVRAGSIDASKLQNYYSQDQKQVISKKFEEYVRIVSQQDGANKRRRLLNLSVQNSSLPTIKNPYMTMKRTYFKKFKSDAYNFYKPAIKDIVRSTQSTFQTMISPTNYTSHCRQVTERSKMISKSISRTKLTQISQQKDKSPLYSRTRSPKHSRMPTDRDSRQYRTLDEGRRGKGQFINLDTYFNHA